MTVTRRLEAVILGLASTFLGLAWFTFMCGRNVHIVGALLGAVGGSIIGVRRRVRRVRWFATGGGILMALLAVGMEYVSQGSCAGAFNAIGSGALIGFGVGSIVDGGRPSARAEAGPPPQSPTPADGTDAA